MVQVNWDLTFDWQQINGTIPEQYFSVNDFVGEHGEGELISFELDGNPLRLSIIRDGELTTEIEPHRDYIARPKKNATLLLIEVS